MEPFSLNNYYKFLDIKVVSSCFWLFLLDMTRNKVVSFQISKKWETTKVVTLSLVVSTVVSDILFARFSTVKCITKVSGFLLWRHSCSEKNGRNTLDYRKTGKKNARYYSRDYFSVLSWVKIQELARVALWKWPMVSSTKRIDKNII